MQPRLCRRLAVMMVLTAIYFVAGKLGLLLAFVHASATPVWPPTGIALAAFLVLGYRVWPGILLGAFLVNVTTAGSIATSIGIALGNTLEGLVGAYLVNRFANGRHAFDRARDIFKFAALAGMLSTTVSATFGVTSLCLGGFADWADYGRIWWTWWLGDAGGALVVAPLLLLWSDTRRWRWQGGRVVEAVLLLLSLFLVGLAVFVFPSAINNYPLEFLCMPLLAWAAFRFGQREAATAIVVLSGFAIWGTLRGLGPFVKETPNESLLLLQAFMGVIAVTTTSLAAVVREHRRAAEELLAARDDLAVQLADMTRLHEMSVRLSSTLELQPILDDVLREVCAVQGTHMGLFSFFDPQRKELDVGASIGFDQAFLDLMSRMPASVSTSGICLQERRRIVVQDIEADPRFASYVETARLAGFRAVHSTPLFTRSGRFTGVLSTHFPEPHRPSDREIRLVDLYARQAVDLIENARLYQELQEADRRKNEFLAMLAHELRNPLAPIRNALHIMKMPGADDAAVDQARQTMERQIHHLVRLVDDLLDVSRITRGKAELRQELVDLAAVFGRAVETARPVIDAHGHELSLSLPPEPLRLQADPTRLAQVIANLLTNAAKYTEHPGQIWLTGEREGHEIVIGVRDQGIGIRADLLPQIFDLFVQSDRSLERSQGGLGIGLTVARRLVEMHGGTITAHSDGPGTGSEFVVRLPALVKAPRTADADVPQAEEEAAMLAGAGRVLVVDDNVDAAETLALLVGLWGHEVRMVHNGPAALEIAPLYLPDLVLLDIGLPGMDGYEVARELRRRPGLDRAVLVAVTGYGREEDRRRSREAGFEHHLTKPVDPDRLQRLLASLPALQAAAAD